MDTTTSLTAEPPQPMRQIADLPGPRGLPWIGNLLQLQRATIHRSVERWCDEFGPLFKFRIGRRRIVVLADHERIAAALRDRPDGWRRTQQLQQVGREMGLLPGVFGAEGDSWRRQRRMVMSGLDPGRVRAYFPSLRKVTERARKRWHAAAQSQRPLDLSAELM